MAEATVAKAKPILSQIRDYFGMTAKQMMHEWGAAFGRRQNSDPYRHRRRNPDVLTAY